MGVDRIPAEPVHDAEEVADGGLDIGLRLVVEVDADDRFAAGQGQTLRPREDDPDMLDAARPVEFGVGGALVGGQGAGEGDAVRDGGGREVEVHGVVSRLGWGDIGRSGLTLLVYCLLRFKYSAVIDRRRYALCPHKPLRPLAFPVRS